MINILMGKFEALMIRWVPWFSYVKWRRVKVLMSLGGRLGRIGYGVGRGGNFIFLDSNPRIHRFMERCFIEPSIRTLGCRVVAHTSDFKFGNFFAK